MIFETVITSNSSIKKAEILMVCETGVFINIGDVVLLYNLQGQYLTTLSRPELTSAIPSNSSYSTSQNYQVQMVQTSDAIYRISLVQQISSKSYPNDTIYTYFMNIMGWKLSDGKALVWGRTDLNQNIFVNDTNIQDPFDIQIEHSGSKYTIMMLYTTITNLRPKLLEFEMSLNGFHLKSSKTFADTIVSKNSYRRPVKWYFLLGSTVVGITQVLLPNKNEISINNTIQDLNTGQHSNFTISSRNYLQTRFAKVGSFLMFYGGINGADSVNNKFHAVLFQISVLNQKLIVRDVLGNFTKSEVNPITSLATEGNNLYITAGTKLYRGDQPDTLIVYNGAIHQSPLISGIDPGIQLNTIGLLFSLVYTTVEYLKYRKQSQISTDKNLTFPEN